jgi:Transposase, Mutator family
LRTQKWGSRRGLKRYRCEQKHNFSIDFRPKPEPFWKAFIAGTPLSGIAEQSGLTSGAVAKRLKRELAALPKNEDITKQYCTNFCGVLVLDGVYVAVKGLPKKIPFIYGIDFLTHDIPAGILDFAESEAAFLRLFLILKEVGYPLKAVVCDEAMAVRPALRKVFPDAVIQLCHVHVLRNIREDLHLSSFDKTHMPFFREIQRLLAAQGEENRRNIFKDIALRFDANELYWGILKSIRRRWEDLFRYEATRRQGIACPRDTNLIEAFNGQFKDRYRNTKGFEMISSAERFVNAWMIKRRFTPFRECGEHFKHLNGHTSFEKSRNPDLPMPDILW